MCGFIVCSYRVLQSIVTSDPLYTSPDSPQKMRKCYILIFIIKKLHLVHGVQLIDDTVDYSELHHQVPKA